MQTRRPLWKIGCFYPVTSLKVSRSGNLYLNRSALARQSSELKALLSGVIVITASLDWPAVCVYSEHRWDSLRPRLECLPTLNPEARRLQRRVLGNVAYINAVDALSVPQNLVELGGYASSYDSRLWLIVFDNDTAELWSEHQLQALCIQSQLEQGSLIKFLRGDLEDHRGRWMNDVLALDDFWLEHTHDYIQWLFPIDTPSRANLEAPVLTEVDREWFRRDPFLRYQHRRALDRMLRFCGLRRMGDKIDPLDELHPNQHIWLKRGGHNHLRITRIIRSLHLCHQPELARLVQQAFISIGKEYGYVQPETLAFWSSATES